MMIDPIYEKGKHEIPNYNIEEMDLIDLRRKIMKWCNKSQGAIGPCRSCVSKCQAGIKALELYDGIDAARASEPEVSNPFVRKPAKAPEEIKKVEIKKEEPKMKKEEKKSGEKPISKWYEDAVASGDPVKWCVENLGLTIQKAKKRVYMYEYNRFGMRRTKNNPEQTKMVAAPEPVAKTANDEVSLITVMEAEMKSLEAKQQEYKARIDELTAEYNRISNKLEAISMCVEQYRSVV